MLFAQYVEDAPAPGEAAEAEEGRPVDISKALKAEVSQLKKRTSSLFHIKYMTGVHGSGFLVFEPSEIFLIEISIAKAVLQMHRIPPSWCCV